MGAGPSRPVGQAPGKTAVVLRETTSKEVLTVSDMKYTVNSKVSEVFSDPVLEGHGRLLFPMNAGYWKGDTLGDIRLTWYSYIRPEKTAEICNRLHEDASEGNQIFFDIYSEEEKKADPWKKDTGLFFFRGRPGGKFAICNAGGGFAFVGAIHDSLPHALELSKLGYNAFALIYRPDGRLACRDLARAINTVFRIAPELGIDTGGYSLWGGSAGARMAAWLGCYGTESFGEGRCPRPATVVMQYTGLSEVAGTEPPTYSCVGTADGISPYRLMQKRTDLIRRNGTDAEIEIFPGLPHGFGLGTGTVAEGWLGRATNFWKEHTEMEK